MPDTLLVNTTNTTLKKMWALSSRRSLSRKKKKCIPQIKCNGRRGCISNGPKLESGLELAFEGSTDIECRGGELDVIFFTVSKVWSAWQVKATDWNHSVFTSVSGSLKLFWSPNSLHQHIFAPLLDQLAFFKKKSCKTPLLPSCSSTSISRSSNNITMTLLVLLCTSVILFQPNQIICHYYMISWLWLFWASPPM